MAEVRLGSEDVFRNAWQGQMKHGDQQKAEWWSEKGSSAVSLSVLWAK